MDISKTEHSPTPMRVGLNFSPTLKVFLTQKERRITLYMYDHLHPTETISGSHAKSWETGLMKYSKL